jgi:hypothetical protein
MPEFQLIALGILIFCSALLVVSFLPAVKSKMQSVSTTRPKKTKPSKQQKTQTPSSDAQQTILDAINIMQLKMTALAEEINQITEDVGKL